MSLRVRIVGEQAVSGTLCFEQNEVTIGRSAKADVRLNPGHTACASGIHARFLRENGQWRLRAEHANGLSLVRSNRGPRQLGPGQDCPVGRRMEFRIGADGPQLVAEVDQTRPTSAATDEVHIRIVSGHNSRWEKSFGQNVITIGRARDADVRLHPTRDTACAREVHAKLLRRGPLWVLESVHHSGVRVSAAGRRPVRLAQGKRMPLEADGEIVLGTAGPKLAVRLPKSSSDDLPPTCVGEGGFSRMMPITELPSRVIEQALKADAGRTKTWAIRGGGGVVLLGLLLTVFFSGGASEEERLKQNLEQARASVFVVGTLDAQGNFQPDGTAWAVAPGRLATNGHIADLVERVKSKGGRIVARRPGNPPRDLPILGTQAHPGWARWKAITAGNYFTRSGSPFHLAPVFDVALLLVSGDVGRVLPIASKGERLALRAGQKVGYIGFPTESVVGVQVNLPATISIGHITNVTDVLGESAPPEQRQLVQYDLTTTGGSSGSPVLNADGHVIALNNAGNVVMTSCGRVSNGLNLGQRVDLLVELMDGSATTVQPERNARLQERLEQVLLPVDKMADAWAEANLAALGKSNPMFQHAQLHRLEKWQGPLRSGPGNGLTHRVSLDGGTAYLVVSVASDFSDVDAKLLSGSRLIAEDRDARSAAILRVAPDTTASFTVISYAEQTRAEQPTAYTAIYLIELR